MNAAAAAPAKPHQTEIWGIIPDKRRTPHGWPICLKKQPPRVAFKNNDIYMINDKESTPYEEPRERNMRVLYKLKVNEDPAFKNMPDILDISIDILIFFIFYIFIIFNYFKTIVRTLCGNEFLNSRYLHQDALESLHLKLTKYKEHKFH